MTRKFSHVSLKTFAYSSAVAFVCSGAVLAQQPKVGLQQAEPEVRVEQAEPNIRIKPAQEQPKVKGAESFRVTILPPEQEQTQQAEAQAAQAQDQAQAQAQAQAQMGQPAQEQQLAQAQQVVGKPLVDDQGEQLGQISNVVRERDTGELRAVVASGSILGAGQEQVVIPLSELRVQDDQVVYDNADAEETLATFEVGEYEEVDLEEAEPLG